MQETFYPFTLAQHELRYEFVSVSAEKRVKKVVLVRQSDDETVYNLALLDLLSDGELCDITETKNKDFRTVMATTIKIITDFFKRNPGSNVVFRGSDPKRHRLYSMIITRELHAFHNSFEILGVIDSVLYPFTSNSSYHFYLIRRKHDTN
ncbi:DUF6934 family protein [Dyadobacter sp. CY327]|uniref:DUF6934 family protein n=1 Tax=Dyadobacter sp. CY327 TaxID=2907301 RepID=UPI0038D5000E